MSRTATSSTSGSTSDQPAERGDCPRRAGPARRRWWQRLTRAAALVGLLLAAAYVTLPYWAPCGLIRRHLAAQMSEQTGLPVTIDAMRLSWTAGVQLDGLRVGPPKSPLAVVPTLRADLNPLEMLLAGKIAWMELDQPQIFIRVGDDGATNLAPLAGLKSDAEAQRISVRRGQAVIELPRRPEPLRLHISDAQYLAGRVHRLGRITVSAALDQSAQGAAPAPVSLRVAAGTGEQHTAADAQFNFANVDLALLQLPEQLELPLEHLRGRAHGSLDLRINRQGVVDTFSVDVVIRQLDVQPSSGPELPVIDEAGMHIAAAFDPMTGYLDLRSASVRLPGLDLSGRGSLFADASQGAWQAIDKLELTGTIHPDRLAAVLTGRTGLPGGLEITGPLAVGVAVDNSQQAFAAAVRCSATDAAIARDGRQLKPPGRAMELRARAELDPRTWHLRVAHDAIRLQLGENVLHAEGTVGDIRPWAAMLRDGAAADPAAWMEMLALLDGDATWELRQPDALATLLGDGEPGDFVRLDGNTTGRCSVRQFDSTELHLNLAAAADAELTVGELWTKPSKTAVTLDVSARLAAPQCELRRIAGELTVGDGRLSLFDGALKLRHAEGLTASGRFEVERLAELLNGWRIPPTLPLTVDGAAEGECRLRAAGDMRELTAQADLIAAELTAGEFFRKPAGRPLRLAAQAAQADAQQGPRLTIQASFPRAELHAAAHAAPGKPTSFDAQLDIADAAWLSDHVPLAARYLDADELAGAALLHVRAELARDAASFAMDCRADAMNLATRETLRRVKAAGVPLSLHTEGAVSTAEDNRLAVQIDDADLRAASAAVTLAGRAVLAPTDQAAAAPAAMRLETFELDAKATVSLSDELRALSPELHAQADIYGLTGSADVHVFARGDAAQLHVTATADAADLAAEHMLHWESILPEGDVPAADYAGRTGYLPDGRAIVHHSLRLAKPAGLSARAELELTAPRDLSRVQVNNLLLETDGVSLLADATANLDANAAHARDVVRSARGQLCARISDAGMLGKLLPDLLASNVSGQATVDCRWALRPGEALQLAMAEFRAQDLAARYRDKDVTLGGMLALRDVQLTRRDDDEETRDWSIGRVTADSLELSAGDNHCWLIADLQNLPAAATGEAHLLAVSLDVKDLRDWLAKPTAQPSPATQPDESPYRLSDEQVERLAEAAHQTVDDLRAMLGEAKLDFRLTADRLRPYDAAVGQSYLVRNMRAGFTAEDGLLQARYVGGMEGGTIAGRYAVHLADAVPMVTYETSLRELADASAIQPQLERFFPGNTVYGEFSRHEEASVAMENLLANSADPRYPLRQTGEAKSIATDGLLEGRAAPRFVARFFPGLNLARYRYHRMTSFAEFTPDGTAHNDMVFSGHTYDIYIEGTTDAENTGRYQVGLILLGSPQSAEWNHLYRQGRIPILNRTAQIEGGQMRDEVVTYPLPTETLFTVFLKNNIFYRIWLAANQP